MTGIESIETWSNENCNKGERRSLTIIHFNDVYDIACQNQEPIGGATRFCTAVKKYSKLNPLVLFSGDCFSPSILSTLLKGEQMVPVLNSIKTTCAVYGNHDFDFGVEGLADLVHKTNFPWLMSNVLNNETGAPLGDGKITWSMETQGKTIGFMGLVEREWLETLSKIDPNGVTYKDYVEVGTELAKRLRSEGCDLVIALTHMRFPNDIRLAEESDGIDLILGGHDHVYDVKHIKGIPVLKSGTDFRDFSVITVSWEGSDSAFKPTFQIDRISVTSDYEEDPELKMELDGYSAMMDTRLDDILGEFHVDLDGRFTAVRTGETNLGNFMCDIMLASCNAECAILNSGTLRSDRVHPAGPFSIRDLLTVLPKTVPLVVLKVTGTQLIDALENGVSQYPKLEGRFPQVAGIRFAFDPLKPAGNRIDPKFVRIGEEYLQPHQFYQLVTKTYVATGHDGYNVLVNCEILKDEEVCEELSIAVQNHFSAIKMVSGIGLRASQHHQSLDTMSKCSSRLQSLSDVQVYDTLSASSSSSPSTPISGQGNATENMEKITNQSAPVVEGRILIIENTDMLQNLIQDRVEWEAQQEQR